MTRRELIAKLEAAGWRLDREGGEHSIYRHPDQTGAIPISRSSKDIPKGTAKRILKRAGLK